MSVILAQQTVDSRMERKGDWIQTYTGRQYWPLDPRPEDICIEDIAHALGNSPVLSQTKPQDTFLQVGDGAVFFGRFSC